MTLPNEFTVYGSEEMLKPLILQLLAQHFMLENLDVQTGSGGYEERSHPSFKQFIKIKLKFFGLSNTGKEKKVESSFRLVKEDYKTITYERIKYYGERIYQKFNNWEQQLGKISYNYVRWEQGYQLQQIYSPSEAEAKRLIEQILDIQEHSPDWDFLRYENCVNPLERFPEIPEKVTVAGQSIRTMQQRPLGKVKFSKALIKFPFIPDYQILCDKRGVVLKDLNFLKRYNE